MSVGFVGIFPDSPQGNSHLHTNMRANSGNVCRPPELYLCANFVKICFCQRLAELSSIELVAIHGLQHVAHHGLQHSALSLKLKLKLVVLLVHASCAGQLQDLGCLCEPFQRFSPGLEYGC